jgi:myo-inositol 2-dehydrogenase / D-chiro-inositol 1-dehydrogenase
MTAKSKSTSASRSRREFLRTSTVAATVALGSVPLVNVRAEGAKKVFKVALIGCGGRGCGALENHIEAAKALNAKLGLGIEIQVVATADWAPNKARWIGKKHGVPESRCFGGVEAYKQAIEAGPEIVIMGQPPVFRPVHFEAAVKAGKHVFFEKPSAVDPPGVRRVIAAGELAQQKGLCVVAGTQRRHEQGYNQRAREIQQGAYGRILGGRVAWNMGAIFGNTPIHPKTASDLVGSGRWVLWTETSGDHIVEQHVHNLDVANWFLGAHPVSAGGFGYRVQRVAGNMYDFFSIDLEYPNNVHIHSMCRQMADCWEWVGEDFTYERAKPSDFKLEGEDPYAVVGYPGGGYVAEHAHLLHAIITGRQINEARNVATSTGTAILGRESAYCGKRITWEEMFTNPTKNPKMYNLQLRPSADDYETGDVVMLKDGDIRFPGKRA